MLRLPAALAIAVLTITAAPVHAGDYNSGDKGKMCSSRMCDHGKHHKGAMLGKMLHEYPEGTKAFLMKELAITEQQQPALEAYLNFKADMYKQKKEMKKEWKDKREKMDDMAPAEVLQHKIEKKEKYIANLRQKQTMVKELYDAFSSEQRETAKELKLFY